jgi:hypothetical protein
VNAFVTRMRALQPRRAARICDELRKCRQASAISNKPEPGRRPIWPLLRQLPRRQPKLPQWNKENGVNQ